MVALLTELAQGSGFSPSRLPGVRFMRAVRHVPRTPIVYEPSIVIIARGRKIGHLGGRRFDYDAHHFLVLSVPLPFECETFGTPEEPLLGVKIGVTPALVTELLMSMQSTSPIYPLQSETIQSARLDDALASATVRLLESLRSDDEARILGPQIVREIIYRVLLGELGGTLRALAAPNSAFGQISRALHRIHAGFAHAFDVPTLAREVGMSVSTFHERFKAVTSSSPLQYVKSIRLHRARLLMVHDGVSASAAAAQVGYESPSQFNREFKRLFGDTPAAVAHNLRETLTRLE
jgi:AraC-like DNA-binding protein